MAAAASREGIILNFGWKGPSTWRGEVLQGGLNVEVVDLVFKGATTRICVQIPNNISPSEVRELPFTCRKYDGQETYSDLLKVTIGQIRDLTITTRIFEGSSHKKPTIGKVQFEASSILEIDQTYTLVVKFDAHLSLSATLLKKEMVDGTMKDKR